jgi:hypothetical protein
MQMQCSLGRWRADCGWHTCQGCAQSVVLLFPLTWQDLDLSSYGIANGVMLGPAGGAIPRLTEGGQVG